MVFKYGTPAEQLFALTLSTDVQMFLSKRVFPGKAHFQRFNVGRNFLRLCYILFGLLESRCRNIADVDVTYMYFCYFLDLTQYCYFIIVVGTG